MSQSNYKESNILFVGKIPSDWIVRSMRSLFTFGRGRVISNEEIADNVGEYPVYSSQTKNEGVLGYINTYDFNGEYVTWTTDGANAGTVFYREGKFNCTNVCGTIQPKKEGVVYLKLLPYYLNFATKEYVRYDINPKLMNNVMGDIPICFPESYSEQKYIVDYLDEQTSNINSIIAKNEELIRLLEEKRLSLINQVITKGLDHNVPMKDSGVEWIGEIPEHWSISRLKFLINKNAQYGANCEPEPDETKFDYRYVRITDIDDDASLKDNIVYLCKEDAKGFVLKEGDILFARSGATVGKTYLYDSSDGDCCFAGYLIRYVPNKLLLNPKYLLYFSFSKSYTEWIKIVSTQATIQNVSADKYDNLIISLPDVDEQNKIVSFLDDKITNINKTISKIQENINLLEEYKTSLIHHVVTGKIDVRGEEI